MSFLISDAWAQSGAPAPAGEAGTLVTMLPLLVIFLIFYFLLIRPQAKRAKEHKKLTENLAKGDEVVTNGGLMGRITEVGSDIVTMEIADGVQVKLQRQYVTAVLPKGTLRSL